MAKSELVYEFLGSRNLFTTPIDITGLQGDKYDYELVTFFEDEGGNSELQGTFNNDTATNYRKYNLQGDGSSPSASTAETRTAVEWGMNCYSFPTLGIFNITGDSSGERVINGLSSQSSSSGDTRVSQKSMYWKDTLNEITSIQLKKNVSITSNCHIMLYRVPKAASQGNWEKVDELNWAAETAEKSFTGLDGNRDKKYKVVWDVDASSLNTIRVNGDSSNIYTRQYLRNNNGSIQALNTTSLDAIYPSSEQGEIIINAETGKDRLCISTGSKTTASQQFNNAAWYSDIVTNITSLDCTPSASTTGTATLYRMKGNGETDGSLPWELIEEVDVSGDFSSGHVFDNLTGNSEKLYRLEFVGTTLANLQCRMNGDVAANQHITQRLRGESSSTSALQTITSSLLVSQTGSTGATFDMVIYPKTGSQRPALSGYSSGENNISRNAHWYVNTVDEITSILIDASSTATVTGKLKLWRLK